MASDCLFDDAYAFFAPVYLRDFFFAPVVETTDGLRNRLGLMEKEGHSEAPHVGTTHSMQEKMASDCLFDDAYGSIGQATEDTVKMNGE